MNMLKSFLMALVAFGFAQSSAAQDSRMCRQQADRFYVDCLNGGSRPNDCEFRTVCDDICGENGSKTCRVFDCRGVLFSTYNVSCQPPAPQYACIRCYLESQVWDSYYQAYKYRYCYKVYDTRNGRREVIDFVCSAFDYEEDFAQRRCDTTYGSDLRCIP